MSSVAFALEIDSSAINESATKASDIFIFFIFFIAPKETNAIGL